MQSEIVQGNDLRHGDIIIAEVANFNGELLGHWGNTKVLKDEKGFYWLDFVDKQYDDRFNAHHFFQVKSPRPEPEMNEFGPVSP